MSMKDIRQLGHKKSTCWGHFVENWLSRLRFIIDSPAVKSIRRGPRWPNLLHIHSCSRFLIHQKLDTVKVEPLSNWKNTTKKKVPYLCIIKHWNIDFNSIRICIAMTHIHRCTFSKPKWFHSYWLEGSNFWDFPLQNNASCSWRKMWQTWYTLRGFNSHKITDSRSTSVWFDDWHSVSPICNWSLKGKYLKWYSHWTTKLKISFHMMANLYLWGLV